MVTEPYTLGALPPLVTKTFKATGAMRCGL